ncbi:MAG: tetratricopeptide repeat protein [Myxococcales bacterium]|nr:tetratricopeptide repeat protein [Myxococcales bacterium]
MSAARHAIAPYATAFVGAPSALDALSQRRESGARLLALRGAPGVGKTRVAIEWARAYAARMGWRAALVDLAPVDTLQDCTIAIARALGVRLEGPRLGDDELAKIVVARLGELGAIILVLDGVDRVAEAIAPLLEAMLAGSEATLLVTARASLSNSDGGVEVRPLRVPAANAGRDEVLRSPAVVLFVDRARSIWRDYRPSGAELESIAAIVRAVDGLPLAIELASSRLAVATATQLAPLVGPSIDLFVAPERGLDLRTVIGQSWAALEPAQRRLLERLSICEGGFDLELASGVHRGASADRVAQHIACVDALHALVRRSLVESFEHHDGGGARRFRVLEPIRMFAAAQLDARGERAEVERAFVRAVRELPSSSVLFVETLDALRFVLREERNYRKALALAEAQDDDESVIALLVTMAVYHRLHGPIAWWMAAEERSRHRLARVSNELRRDALITRVQFTLSLGGSERAREALNELEERARASDERELLAWALSKQSIVSALLGELDASARQRDQARSLLGSCSDSVRLRVLRDAAWTLSRAGDRARAEQLYREALEIALRIDATLNIAPLYHFIGHEEFDRGALDEAATHLLLACEIADRCADRRVRYASTGTLGLVYTEQGRLDEARETLQRALDGHMRYGERWYEAETRTYFGFLSLESGAATEADRWFREATAIHDETNDVASKSMADVGRVLALHELGERAAARALLEEIEARVTMIDRSAVVETIDLARRADGVSVARQLAASGSNHEAESKAGELRDGLRGVLAERPEAELRIVLRSLLAIVERLLARWQEGVRGARAFEVAFDGSWVRVDGVTIELTRASERKMVLALARANGAPLSLEALFDAGWKGERAAPEAKTNRVRVALTGLRRAGLRSVIERTAEGYRLSPDCAIKLLGA